MAMNNIEAGRIADRNVCGKCGGNLAADLRRIPGKMRAEWYVKCANGCNVNEVGMDSIRNHPSKREEQILNERKVDEMVMSISKEKAVAIRQYALAPRLNREQAIEVLQTCWPKAPKEEVLRAALLCATYQLNPLMKHVFLIPYGQGDKQQWSIQIGIGATRLAASRRGPVSYIDGPRIMTDAEQKSIRGRVEVDKIWAITKLGGKGGATAVGYGNFPRNGNEPKGIEKGNSRENMAMIRSERQALDRLYPAEMPMGDGVETVDESFEPSPLPIIEGESRDISDAKELPPSDAGSPAAASGASAAEETPAVDPYPLFTAKYGDILAVCPTHGDGWSISEKFNTRSHKVGDEWCKFNEIIKPITEEICKAANIEDGLALNEKIKPLYEGRTWSKFSEAEKIGYLETLMK
jgi:hypothetical protein